MAETIIDIYGLRLGDNNRDLRWLLVFDSENGTMHPRHTGYGIPSPTRQELNMIVQAAFNYGYLRGQVMGTRMDLITMEIRDLLGALKEEKAERAPDPTSEANRALALAITKVEEAQLWLSKA
jgi:hypothetical protein